MSKSKPLIRAYAVDTAANAAKVETLKRLYEVYRQEFGVLIVSRFRSFLNGDASALSYLGSTKGAETELSQSYYQGMLARVCEALKSHTGHLRNRSLKLLEGSTLQGRLREQVFFLCRTDAWTSRNATWVPRTGTIQDDFGNAVEVVNVLRRRESVSPEAFRMVRRLLKRARKEIAFPDVRNPRILLDSRTGTLKESKARGFSHWLSVSTLEKGKRVALPISLYDYAAKAPGRFAGSMELGFRNGKLSITLFRKSSPEDWSERFEFDGKIRTDETLALDWGMTTLLATNNGELLGRNWLERIRGYDERLTALASRRQKLGLKTRSKRYDELRRRIAGFVKTEIGRVLNRLVSRYPNLKTLTIEKLNLFDSALSRRMNRLLRTIGFGTFRKKLDELAAIRGFGIVETNPAWSSQECPRCGFVHQDNRKTQSVFECILCGRKGHADAIAASNLGRRSSLAGKTGFLPKERLLACLHRRFTAFLAGDGSRYRKRHETLSRNGIAFGVRRALPALAKAETGGYN